MTQPGWGGSRQAPALTASPPGVYDRPSLSAQPGPAVTPGGDVTLQCNTRYGFDRFALHKEGDPGASTKPERWYRADFPLVTVTAAHSGTYRCYTFSSNSPYLWSAPSNPLQLVVTVPEVPSSQLPTAPPTSVPGEFWNPSPPFGVQDRCLLLFL
ncbi:PREDICTED: platelet glycoprotein VI [Condylura cristata]|uniref:platelet glycoprotein VI n=1 Tax=Condylura cristata TaxID=143302 RepID=UPI000642986D|nr:PREDICTED: platelet glycoprotein VI [Condylura cristata]